MFEASKVVIIGAAGVYGRWITESIVLPAISPSRPSA
jgi:hypothetical protein